MKRLYRSTRDKKLFGVCGGLGEATGIDSTIIRIVLVITTFFSSGALILVYFIAALVMPKDPTYAPIQGNPPFGAGGGGGSFYGSPNANWNPDQPQPPPQGSNPSFGRTAQGFYPPNASTSTRGASIDDLMDDIEKKALSKEIEELKAKLAQYEKQQKGDE